MMSGIEAIGVLMIRLWAAGLLVTYLSAFGIWLWEAAFGDGEQALADLLVEATIWLTPAIIAFVFAPRFAKLIAPRSAPDKIAFAVSIDDVVAAGAFLIGLFFMLRLGTELIAAVLDVMGTLVDRGDNDPIQIHHFQWQRFFAAATTFAVALFLAFKPHEIARLFARLRQAGLPKADPADEVADVKQNIR